LTGDRVEVVTIRGPGSIETRKADDGIPSPGAAYLARVRECSRRVIELRLRQCLRVVGVDADPRAFPWQVFEAAHVGALSSAIRARYAPSTGRAILVALRGVLRACWQSGCYSWEEFERRVDAFATIEGERVAPGRALAPGEVASMHAIATPRDRALLALLFGAGCRRSEAAGLTWERFDGGSVRVLGKGDRERVVPLPGWAALALQAIRPAIVQPGARILQNARGEALSVEGVRYVVASLATRAKVVRVTPHDARRTFISELLDVADTAVVADLAGHASAEQTRRYDRRGERAGRDAVARVRSIIEPV
jgi:integrase